MPKIKTSPGSPQRREAHPKPAADLGGSVNDDSSSTLTIYNANIDDAGICCVVTAEDGTESEATVNVKIFRKTPFLLLL